MAFAAAAFLPSGGLTLVSVAIVAAGVGTLILAPAMPARTLAGAMIRAMLAAYRRTLEKTIALSRSLDAAVEGARLPWLEAPDQLLVWGTALGLQDELDALLARAVEDVNSGAAPGRLDLSARLVRHLGRRRRGSGGSNPARAAVSPRRSPASCPPPPSPTSAAMFAVLGTIGDTVVVSSSSGGSSSSSSSSSSFGGGSSGGGGGGAGGGF